MRYEPSLYWFDYETFGADPRRDRPVQFAGIRTDINLSPIGDPLSLYCRPADDYLPHPEACLVTGITPQKALAEGVSEAAFIARIHQELSQPNTCGVGYNNIRFDDEVTRFTLYRNFFDAYGHEWQNGNSRWDILDMVRLTHALRPEGINWPKNENGDTSFRLDQLTISNNIVHEAAHEALSDVMATISVAKLIRDRQPKLFDFVFKHRSKQKVSELLNLSNPMPVLHVSSMYPAALGCIALITPLIQHPNNKNEIIVYDLRTNPEPFLNLKKEEIAQRLFIRQDDLPSGIDRLPIKSIHINKCPIVVPANTLTPEAADKWQIEPGTADVYQKILLAAGQFLSNLREVFQDRSFEPNTDPDFMLYDGGFFSNDDKARMEAIRSMKPEELADYPSHFDDPRLGEMLFRYRARNFPETLNQEEKNHWVEFRRQRLQQNSCSAGLSLQEYFDRISQIRTDKGLTDREMQILNALESYGTEVEQSLS